MRPISGFRHQLDETSSDQLPTPFSHVRVSIPPSPPTPTLAIVLWSEGGERASGAYSQPWFLGCAGVVFLGIDAIVIERNPEKLLCQKCVLYIQTLSKRGWEFPANIAPPA